MEWLAVLYCQVSTHVLEDHADEVWCCRFSNGGTMLATSSADGVLILWDIDGGGGGNGGGYGNGGRQGRSAPSLHKRIQVGCGCRVVAVGVPLCVFVSQAGCCCFLS